MLQRTFWLATAAGLAVTTQALAQATAKPGEKPAGTVGEIVVQGTAPAVRVDAEKKSYSLANDLQATTGSVSDALRNVPSVEVDVQGNISLRGDPNVTIMIDGKPSGMFKGEGRAQALQGLPADQIERVEVITNPSAAYNPEGTGGIINLITKKTAKPGVSGSVRASLGSEGRKTGGINASYRSGRFTYTGDASVRRDTFKQRFTVDRDFADPSGAGRVREFRAAGGAGRPTIKSGRASVDFDLDDKTRITGGVRYQGIDFRSHNVDAVDQTTLGLTRLGFNTNNDQRQGRASVETSLNASHKFGEGHDLTFAFTREMIDEDRSRVLLRQFRTPVAPSTFEDAEARNRLWRTQVKLDYTRPLGEGRKLKLGYELNGDDNDYVFVFGGATLPGPAAVDPTRSNLFRLDQQTHGAYVTYEQPVGKVTVLAGLRAEATLIDLNQVTQGRTDENDYVRLYPSLHLGYPLAEGQQLTASYSRRVQRPQAADYNAFQVYIDPQNLSGGNPKLKPQITDAFELGYQYRKSGTIFLATAYYRDGRDAVNDILRDLGDGQILQTKENIGSFRSAGLELVANGRLPGKLRYNVSGNLLWSEIDATDLGFGAARRSAYTASGRASLDWQPTDKDFVQLQGYMYGKRLLSQGYSEPQGILNLGYRHKFADNLSGVVTVQDIFALSRFDMLVDTPAFRERTVGKPKNRAVFVGVTYAFGGGKPRDTGFDFGAGGQ
ncbi:MAG: TonB-dependent receptor [Alphaproteobacteria bacterium]|nr:TonB-dependent receptor [Alphaproteobacteria bacterium]MBU1514154.1 TonB-dependent receptor [Alphaproteobacteria bacterium]MBU2096197.1 TonB-dependent receptor [Alphaproteobacteria bacterium]MBU2151151.1 TonB-dependent receptor [Alphaproteobacteria bacterium]MBU2307190.1 TonB-dependent receptor [Alphaproteobacteria bacterium]